jgi:Zn-dependent M28 family amino/carboxypeptidase
VLEIAEAMTVARPAPERSVLFVLVTLEESGLLGSKYYVAHPLVPLANTVAVINIDALPVVGPTRDMVVVGLGNSELDDVLAPIAKKQNRELVPESSPEKGQFFRSDHFSFAKRGVPALSFESGEDWIDGGKAAGEAESKQYNQNRYHQPADEWQVGWSFSGMARDLGLLQSFGSDLANSDRWPNWAAESEFRAARDATAEERK